MSRTHYDTLGVSPKASAPEIRSAYRKLVLKYHPDTSKDTRSSQLLMEVVKAYEVLSDPLTRQNYDSLLGLDEARQKPPPAPTAAKAPPPKKPVNPKVPKGPSITDDLIKLSSLFSKSRFEEAEKLAYRILEKNPREAIPYGVLGDIARARGDLSQAINMYAHAVQADPRNHLYQQRYEELVRSTGLATKPIANAAQQSAIFFGSAVCVIASTYIALSRESAIAPTLGLVSTWSLGLVVMLFLCGVAMGVSLSIAGKLDRFASVTTTSTGKIAPAMALGTIAVVSFWAAAALYGILGVSQNAFNFSTSRVVAAVAAVVCLISFAAAYSATLNPVQVFLWGGNLSYIGAICGWMVSDSFKRV